MFFLQFVLKGTRYCGGFHYRLFYFTWKVSFGYSESFWRCSPGGSIGGDRLAASFPASSTFCSDHCSRNFLVFPLISRALQYVRSPLVLWPVLARGRAKLPLPKSRPLDWESPAVRGSTLLGPAQGELHWEEKRGPSYAADPWAEDVKIAASITSGSTPPPVFRFYELTKRWLRLFSRWLIVSGPRTDIT